MLLHMVSVDGSRQPGAGVLQVIIADDEEPAIAELSYLLARDERIGTVHAATDGTEVLRLLEAHRADALFLDIHMPGLSGLDIAQVVNRFARADQPAVVFVTADEDQALQAFELAAVDYLLKPVRTERLTETVRRIIERRIAEQQITEQSHTLADQQPAPGELITVDQGGVTKLIRRSEVRYVQAQGDYARLHTPEGSFLIRVPLSELAEQWSASGFLRIHRSYVIALHHLTHVRLGKGGPSVGIDGTQLPVSRRHLPVLRERMSANRVRPRA